MKRLLYIGTLLLLSTCLLKAQEGEEGYSRKGKFFIVPEFWMSFGTNNYIELAPLVGYHISDRIAVGAGPHYIFRSGRATPSYPRYQSHAFGLKGFARMALITNAEQFLPFNIFSDLFVHMEYEGLNLEKDYYAPGDSGRELYNLLLVGGGITQRFGMYNSLSIMVLWDLNETSDSPYTNPVFRIGFNAYL